jgi:hypothetical protein
MTVAIPSHHRSETIGKHALRFTLQLLQVPPKDVFVFVSDEGQLSEYRRAIGAHGVNIICANTKCVRDKFNFVHSYFNDGRDVLVIEDDVKGFISISDIAAPEIIKQGFQKMRELKKSLWGIYPSSNKFYMRKAIQCGFNFIVANVYGFIADGDKNLLIKEHSKTDYERSILYYKHKGGSVRFDYVAADTNNYTNKGGMQLLDNRAQLESTACLNLIRRFPNYVSYKTGTKSRYTEIKLLK